MIGRFFWLYSIAKEINFSPSFFLQSNILRFKLGHYIEEQDLCHRSDTYLFHCEGQSDTAATNKTMNCDSLMSGKRGEKKATKITTAQPWPWVTFPASWKRRGEGGMHWLPQSARIARPIVIESEIKRWSIRFEIYDWLHVALYT